MNILSKAFGASGKISIDLDAQGLHVAVSDSEKLSDQSLAVTVKPDVVIDAVVSIFKSPAWLVSVGSFLKAELVALASQPAS